MGVVKSKKHRIMIIVLVALSVCVVICATVYYIISRALSFDDSGILVFDDSGILVEYKSTPAWDSSGRDQSYGVKIIINNDGTAEIINTPKVIRENKEIPSVSFTIDASVVAGLQDDIKSTEFFVLRKDVSTDSCDGSYVSITVYTKTKTHRSSGLNPSNKRFDKVRYAIWEAVPEDVMEEYELEVDLYYSD